jgi:hypothetical protein
MPRTSRNPKNAVNGTYYASLAQHAHIKEVAAKFYGGNINSALMSRFTDVDDLFGVPVFLRQRVEAAASAAGLSIRDYVVKVFTEFAMALPEPRTAPKNKG